MTQTDKTQLIFEHYLQRLKEPQEKIAFLQEIVNQLVESSSRPASEVILDDVELRDLLKISRRTALVYRQRGVIPYYKVDNKIYYILAEVINGIKKTGGNRAD